MDETRRCEDPIDGRAAFGAALDSLAAARRASLARGAISVLLAFAAALLGAGIVLHGASPHWRAAPLVVFVLFWGGLALGIAVAARELLPPRSRPWLAGRLGARTGWGGLFLSALEFSGGDGRLGAYSPYLMAETVRRAARELGRISPRAVFGEEGRPSWTAAAFLLVCALGVQAAFQGEEALRAVASISDPLIALRDPSGMNLQIVSRDCTVLEGERVTAEAFTFGSSEEEVTLRVGSIPGVWKRIALRPDPESAGGVAVTAYRHSFDEVRESFQYYFETPRARTARRRVTVVHRPVINSLSAVLQFPAYTRAAPETVRTLAGRLVALAGTRVELTGETSKPISGGAVRFGDSAAVAVEPTAGGFTCDFAVTRDDTFGVSVLDSMGLESEDAVRYPVVALEDRPPIIEPISPDDDAQLPRSMRMPILYRAADDYGVARVDLRYLREGKEKEYRTLRVQDSPGRSLREIEGRYEWSLEEEALSPGDRVLYYLEACDGNTATGPGCGRTPTRRLLVPSLSEVYAEMRREESAQRRGVEELLEEGKEIRERLGALSEDLKSEGTFDWSKRREGREILEKQRELQEKIRNAAEQLDRTLERLAQNRMTTQEIGRKLEEIRRLMGEIESTELREAIERFQRMLGEVPPDEMMRAMREMEMEASEIAERLDRTIELLKQVLNEEKMEELVRRMEEMLAEQRALRDSTATGDTGELSRRQDELGSETDRFEEDLDGFAAQQEDSSMRSDLDRISEEMQRPSLADQMRKAAAEIERDEREEARCTQGGAMERMLSLYTSLGRCQMCMSMAIEREVIEAIERLTRELVRASTLEEDLAARVRSAGPGRGRGDLLAEQIVLREATRRIVEDLYGLARRTMAISGKVFLHLGTAAAEIEETLGSLQQEEYAPAAASAGQAYREMNLAAVELLRATVSQGGSGGSARDRMQMMLERQMSIDQRLREIFGEGDPRGWSMEERARMARIAAEQREMQELLERMMEESGGAGELLGRIDDIADEMEEIARRLERSELDGDLIDREERILSRMLESQRSMQRRDYTRERVSRTADGTRAVEPGSLEASPGDTETLLDMIRRGMQEKGPDEYEELIRLYFRALSKRARENGR